MAASAASFSYHGSLQDNGKPADGKYDLQLTLYSAANGGKVVGGPLTLYAVPVQHGNFNTQADFGPLSNVQNAWLAVSVKTAGGSQFSALGARVPVSAYATAATGSVCPGAWTLAGNAGNPSGSYLGTADNNPLVFKVNGSVVGQILPTTDAIYANTPSVVFGSSGNSTGSAVGATISGGGTNYAKCGSAGNAPCVNTAGGAFSTVSGGFHNTASGNDATVVGGTNNIASGDYSTIGGGYDNVAGGTYSFAAGYNANVPSGSTGSFVWSDSTATSSAPFTSTGTNQFLINATGGVGINTNIPAGDLTVRGTEGVLIDEPTPNVPSLKVVNESTSNSGSSAISAINFSGYGIQSTGYNVGFYSHNSQVNGGDVYLSTSALAGDFYGNVRVTGNLNVSGTITKGGGSFKIDDPLDPANKFLSHSFVESPDMKDVYDGVATLDANGEASVELPKYFEALNQDFRYQLTALDSPAPSLYIAQRISANHFRIAGGAPNQQVSWQVTGTRHDAWADAHRIPVEQDKPADERGLYLAPEAFGLPANLAIGQATRPTGAQQ